MSESEVMACLTIIDEQLQKLFAYEKAVSEIKKLCEADGGILSWDILNIIDFV